ncbi:tetratricopeptide repeat protein [Lutibacter aestuarii]|uniref:Tetratricopeptide repeat protein n=1 Tax=Lutibacter aestuarii TaxID=861111 RepID=A0ABW2Z8W4_9FLAO|nr:tetratricopeptide repeat protein [uncultured Lutibacter sp.]
MRFKFITTFVLFSLFFSCTTKTNSPEFIKKVSGRYLYNSDEIIEVYFKETDLYLKWRGATNIKPLKVDDETFFVKEMNEKIQFKFNQDNHKQYLIFVPKETTDSIQFNFRKLNETEKIPSEYLLTNQYEKALEAYKAIQEKDSLDSAVNEGDLNSLGYKNLRAEKFENAINIFKINVVLHPESSNVYDSLGEAYMKHGDTIEAIENYKKSLALDSGNNRAKRMIKKLEKKEVDN